ncbi:hypothetical protein [Thalassospira alkalitolerans]|uniref:hypothetical protein n=1 Tax=Thalassospira alkalitolerans TaxID=1293890 RepID=UPI003AA7D7B4
MPPSGLCHSATGLLASQFGPAPVRWFKPRLANLMRFSSAGEQALSLGNFVFAPSGVGKSTLIMHRWWLEVREYPRLHL